MNAHNKQLAKAYEGRMGGLLWAASASSGEKLAQYALDAPPANAVKHFVAAGREPSGVSRDGKNRRACALPLKGPISATRNASQRCPAGFGEPRLH